MIATSRAAVNAAARLLPRESPTRMSRIVQTHVRHSHQFRTYVTPTMSLCMPIKTIDVCNIIAFNTNPGIPLNAGFVILAHKAEELNFSHDSVCWDADSFVSFCLK